MKSALTCAPPLLTVRCRVGADEYRVTRIGPNQRTLERLDCDPDRQPSPGYWVHVLTGTYHEVWHHVFALLAEHAAREAAAHCRHQPTKEPPR